MMCILYLMVFCSTFTFIHTLYKYFFYSEDCNPVYLPREVATAIDYIDLFVTRQLWIYVISQFFWPTKSHIKDDEVYDSQVQHLEQNEKQKGKRLSLSPKSPRLSSYEEQRRVSTQEDTSILFMGVQKSMVMTEGEEKKWL